MHRSRLSVLVIFAAMAACSKRDDSEGSDLLSQDRTLVARLDVGREARRIALPAACGVVAVATQPTVANQAQAKELTQQAQDAEMHGDIREARSLLRRAVELDGTSKSAAYHLGRSSEALGDRTGAMTAYCRYLALAPTTAESAEARQRVTALSQPKTSVAAGSVSESPATGRRAARASVQRVTRRRSTSEPRALASAPVEEPVVVRSAERGTRPESTAPSTADNTAAGSEVVATPPPAPAVDQASTASSTVRRGPSRTQGAIVGAATGAIIGAATGRSVKGAVIGAAAGGIFGTVLGPTIRPMGRGSRS